MLFVARTGGCVNSIEDHVVHSARRARGSRSVSRDTSVLGISGTCSSFVGGGALELSQHVLHQVRKALAVSWSGVSTPLIDRVA